MDIRPDRARQHSPLTVNELARACSVSRATLDRYVALGLIDTLDGEFISRGEALRVGRLLRDGHELRAGPGQAGPPPLFAPPRGAPRSAGLPAAVSSSVHVAVLVGAIWVTTLGLAHTTATTARIEPREVHLVFLDLPGPGGGGGGSGRHDPLPVPKARKAGKSKLSSPVPVAKPPAPAKPPPPKLEPKPLPSILAPVVVAAADDTTREGLPETTPAVEESAGPGEGDQAGNGRGEGLGEGQGSGIGEGYGGGIGGGPYRPGTGIEPPGLLREVKPDYSEDARRASVEGEVVLEIVVLADGTVGTVRVVSGLGYGLDERAVEAVRQWRFSPATRYGQPVDVLVEVAVEFQLR